MAQSPEGPTGAKGPRSDTAAFVTGIVLGLGVGGLVLTLLFFFIAAAIAESLPGSPQATGFVFLGVIPALALGWWAVMRTRQAMNFISGALIGLAAGMLGGVSLCGILIGGFSNMH